VENRAEMERVGLATRTHDGEAVMNGATGSSAPPQSGWVGWLGRLRVRGLDRTRPVAS
jgi:hypothetical protein